MLCRHESSASQIYEVPILLSGRQCSPVNAKLVRELGSKMLTVARDSIVKDMQHDALSLVTRYVGVGYDLIRGSPEGDFDSGGGDPGIKITHHIFGFTYQKDRKAYYMEQPMSLPDQVNFHASAMCAKSFETRAYSGAKSYQKDLSVSVKAQGNFIWSCYQDNVACGTAEVCKYSHKMRYGPASS